VASGASDVGRPAAFLLLYLDAWPFQKATAQFGPVFDGRLVRAMRVGTRADQQAMALGILPIHVCLGGRVQRIKPQTVYRRLLAKLV